jgi:hypothetical protein
MNRKQKIIIAIILLLGFGGIVYTIFFHQSTPRGMSVYLPPDHNTPIRHIDPPPEPLPFNPELYISLSHEAGFFSESFYLTLDAPEGAEIYFTLDGSYPGVHSTRYTGPIFVDAPPPGPATGGPALQAGLLLSRVSLFAIRAVAVRGDEASDIVTRNFVMGTDVYTRFCENTLIFALTSDPHGLFDHHEGILVAGVDRERWRQDFYNRHGRWPTYGYGGQDENPSSPANFNRRGRESEREVFVEMFDHTGVLHISQHAGMRVRGGFSRAVEEQKSLELFAREEYGDLNQFRFAFFEDEYSQLTGNLIDRYRRVRLRNGGSDRTPAFIRDELSQSLFRQAGHSTTQTHRPAAVFLNGVYYGVAWLKSPRTENHLSRLFGGNSNQFEIIAGGDRLDNSWWVGNARATNDFQSIHQTARLGFTGASGDTRFERFTLRVDVLDLIRYYAMQIYINNLDWPNHNIELWRYFPTLTERNDPNTHPYLRDGRWRVFAHDIESAWAIWDNDNRRAYEDTLYHILTGTGDRWNSGGSSAFLHAFVNFEYTKAILANAFVDLIEGAFAPENVIRTLNDLVTRFEHEHNYALNIDAINPGEEWWPSIHSVADSRDAIRRFAYDRPNVMLQSIHTNLGFHWNERFAVTLTTHANGGAIMNTRIVGENETVTVNYFDGTQIKITAQPNDGYEINYWLVNGVRIDGEEYVTVHRNSAVEVYFSPIS